MVSLNFGIFCNLLFVNLHYLVGCNLVIISIQIIIMATRYLYLRLICVYVMIRGQPYWTTFLTSGIKYGDGCGFDVRTDKDHSNSINLCPFVVATFSFDYREKVTKCFFV